MTASCPARMRPTPPSPSPLAKIRTRGSTQPRGSSRPISSTCPPKSSPFRCKTIGAAADGNRAISAASSFQSLPTCEIASTDATASKNGQPNPTRPSGEINIMAVYHLPNMPNMPKSLSHKEDLRADSFLYVPRKCPQRNCCGMGIVAGRAAWAGVKSVRTKSQEVSNEDQGDKDEGARRLVAAIRNSGDVARTQIHGVA